MPKLRVVAALIAVVVSVGLAAGGASAAWGPAFDVSAPGGRATGRSNAVAAAPGGRFVVAWARGSSGTTATTEIQAQRIGNGRTGRTLSLASGQGSVGDVRLWPGPRGRTVATWSAPAGPFDVPIIVRTIQADDRLGPPVTITQPGDGGLAVFAVPQADGATTVAWIAQTAEGSVVKARRISAAGVPGPVSILSPAGLPVDALAGAADVDDGALLVWSARGVLYGQRVTEDGRAAHPGFQITATGQTAGSPQVATDGSGGATVVWVDQSSPVSVHEIAIVADDRLGGSEQLSAAGVASLAPSLAFNDRGGVVVWNAQAPAGTTVVGVGDVGPPTTLSAASTQAAMLPGAAIDAAGNGFAVWQRGSPAGTVVEAALFGQVRPQRVTTLSGVSPPAAFPHIAATPAGRALATWVQTSATGARVQAAQYTPPRARLQLDFPTATVSTAGRLVLRVRCSADDVSACVGGLRLRHGGVLAQTPLATRRNRVRLVPVTLSHRGRALLARSGRLRVAAVVSTRQVQTRRVTRLRQTLTLRLANGARAR